MRVAVAGARGMLGADLVRLVRETRGCELAGAYDVKDGLDLLDREAVVKALASDRPEVLINCAGYTDVDGAETESEAAFRNNRDIPETLGGVARDLGMRLVHASTDYVFDGRRDKPYRESDMPAPLSVYGLSKLEGDRRLADSGADHVIVRTAWLYGRHGRNFVDRIVELSARGGPLKVVDDQRGCPTWTVPLCEALLAVTSLDYQGIVNFACSGSCTWFELATEIVRLCGRDVEVLPQTTTELGRPAPRPRYSVLDTALYERLTGRAPMFWKEALGRYLDARTHGG